MNDAAFDVGPEGLSEEQAYFLGLMITDGHVHHPKPNGGQAHVVLGLTEKDADHVLRFRDFLGSDHSICVQQPRPQVMPNGKISMSKPFHRLAVSSDRLATALAGFGIIPRKTKTAQLLNVDEGMERHAFRGAVDGDGWVGFTNYGKKGRKGDKRKLPVLGLCGSRKLVMQFAGFIKQALGYEREAGVSRKSDTLFHVVYAGRQAMSVARLLYAGCTVALPRKHEAAKRMIALLTVGEEKAAASTAILDSDRTAPRIQREDGRKKLTFKGRTMSVAAWAREIGLPCITLHARLRYGWSVERALTEPVNFLFRTSVACSVLGCTRPHKTKGFCDLHYQRSRAGRDLDAPVRVPPIAKPGEKTCEMDGCGRRHVCHGLCGMHLLRRRRGGDPTSSPGQPS